MTNTTQKTNQELLKKYSELNSTIAKSMHDKNELEKSLDELKSLHTKTYEKIKAMSDIYLAITNIGAKQFDDEYISEINKKLKNYNLESTSFTKKLKALSENASKTTNTTKEKEKKPLLEQKEQLLNEIVNSPEYNHILNRIKMHADEDNAYLNRYAKKITEKEQKIQAIKDSTALQGAELENLKGNNALKTYLEKIKNDTKIETKKLESNIDKLPITLKQKAKTLIASFEAKHKELKSNAYIEENKDLPELLSNIQALSAIADLDIKTRLEKLQHQLNELPQKSGEWDLRAITEGLLNNKEKLFNELGVANLKHQYDSEVVEIDDQLKLFEKLLSSKDEIQNIVKKISTLNKLRKELPENSRISCKIFTKKFEQDIADLFRTLPDSGTMQTTIDSAIFKLNQDIKNTSSNALLIQKNIRVLTDLLKLPKTNELSEPIKNNLKQTQELLNALSFDNEDFSSKLEIISKKLVEDARLRALVPDAKTLSIQLNILQEEINRLANTEGAQALIESVKSLLDASNIMLQDPSKVTNKDIVERTKKIIKIANSMRRFYVNNPLGSHAKLAAKSINLVHFADDVKQKLNSAINASNKLDINKDSFDNDINEIGKTLGIIEALEHENTQEFANKLQTLRNLFLQVPHEKALMKYWEEKLLAIKSGDAGNISDESLKEIELVIENSTIIIEENNKLFIAPDKEKAVQESIDRAKNSSDKVKNHFLKKDLIAVDIELVKLKGLTQEASLASIAILKRQTILEHRIQSLEEFKQKLNSNNLSEDKIIGKAMSLGLHWLETTALPRQAINESKKFLLPHIEKTLNDLISLKAQGDENLKTIESIEAYIPKTKETNAIEIDKEMIAARENMDMNLTILAVRLTNLKDKIDLYFKGCNIISRNFGNTAKTLKNTQAEILKALGAVNKVTLDASQTIQDNNKDKHKLLSTYKYVESLVKDFTKDKGKDIEEIKKSVDQLISERTTPKK